MSKSIETSPSAGMESRNAPTHPTHEQIELRAYQIYIERGEAAGNELQDWLEAERDLLARYAKPLQQPVQMAKRRTA